MMKNRIAEYRHRMKLSQEQLADAVGSYQALVSLWERGLQRTTVETALKLARFFSCKVEDLFVLKGDNEDV